MQWTLSRPQWFYCSEAISPQDSTIMKPPYHHSMHCDYTLQHQPETKQSLHLQCEAHKAKYCVYSSFQMQLNFLADAVLLQHVSGAAWLGSVWSARSRGSRSSCCSHLIPESQQVLEFLGGDEPPQHLFSRWLSAADSWAPASWDLI